MNSEKDVESEEDANREFSPWIKNNTTFRGTVQSSMCIKCTKSTKLMCFDGELRILLEQIDACTLSILSYCLKGHSVSSYDINK